MGLSVELMARKRGKMGQTLKPKIRFSLPDFDNCVSFLKLKVKINQDLFCWWMFGGAKEKKNFKALPILLFSASKLDLISI